MGHIFRQIALNLANMPPGVIKMQFIWRSSAVHICHAKLPRIQPSTTTDQSTFQQISPLHTLGGKRPPPTLSIISRATIVVLHWSHAINMSGSYATDFSWTLPSFFKLYNLLSGDCNNLTEICAHRSEIRCCLFLPSFHPIKVSHVCIAKPTPNSSFHLIAPSAVCLDPPH